MVLACSVAFIILLHPSLYLTLLRGTLQFVPGLQAWSRRYEHCHLLGSVGVAPVVHPSGNLCM